MQNNKTDSKVKEPMLVILSLQSRLLEWKNRTVIWKMTMAWMEWAMIQAARNRILIFVSPGEPEEERRTPT
jgi:hypothetical protein